LHWACEESDVADFPESREPVSVHAFEEFSDVWIQQVVSGDDDDADRGGDGQRQFDESRHQDHAAADDPYHAGHFVVCEIEVEGPGETEDCEFEEDEPEAADDQEARNVGVLAGVEEDAGSSQEDEGWGTEMRDPSGEEDSGSGATGGQAGVDAYMIDGHDDHDGAANDVNGCDAGTGSWSCYGGSGLKSGAHGTLRSFVVAAFPVRIWKHSFDGEGMKRFEGERAGNLSTRGCAQWRL